MQSFIDRNAQVEIGIPYNAKKGYAGSFPGVLRVVMFNSKTDERRELHYIAVPLAEKAGASVHVR